MQGVKVKAPRDWKGLSGDKGKLSLLKTLLKALSECDPNDLQSLTNFKNIITIAKNDNLESEKGGGLVKQARNMFGRHPGGELGKLLDNCEKHVNDIKAGLSERPALKD